jgi:hypothetical protein
MHIWCNLCTLVAVFQFSLPAKKKLPALIEQGARNGRRLLRLVQRSALGPLENPPAYHLPDEVLGKIYQQSAERTFAQFRQRSLE